MSIRTFTSLLIFCFGMSLASGAQPAREKNMNAPSTSLVSMERFLAKLGGRQGSLVLQGSETVANGKGKATWSVVPGSGTGDLAGLRGEGGFEGDLGKGSHRTLDYWFECCSYGSVHVVFGNCAVLLARHPGQCRRAGDETLSKE
jgi:hypothetical protein